MTDFNKVKTLVDDIGTVAIIKALARHAVAKKKQASSEGNAYKFQKYTMIYVLLTACVSGIQVFAHAKKM